jgi:glutathione S-transferase
MLSNNAIGGNTLLTLFHAPGTCSLASLIVLNEGGIKHDVHVVNFANSEQRTPEFLAINPKGRVPALKTERGIITETPSILIYLAQLAPAAGLAPLDDPFALAELQSFNAYLCSTVHIAHAHRPRGSRWADEASSLEDMKRKVPGNMTDCFNLIEKSMFKGPWVLGDTFTVSDAYLFTISNWLASDGVDIASFPRVADHSRRMKERPAVVEAMSLTIG